MKIIPMLGQFRSRFEPDYELYAAPRFDPFNLAIASPTRLEDEESRRVY